MYCGCMVCHVCSCSWLRTVLTIGASRCHGGPRFRSALSSSSAPCTPCLVLPASRPGTPWTTTPRPSVDLLWSVFRWTSCCRFRCFFVSISSRAVKLKFHYADFTETSLRGKSWTQIRKVADTNHLDMSRCLRQSLHEHCVFIIIIISEWPKQARGENLVAICTHDTRLWIWMWMWIPSEEKKL